MLLCYQRFGYPDGEGGRRVLDVYVLGELLEYAPVPVEQRRRLLTGGAAAAGNFRWDNVGLVEQVLIPARKTTTGRGEGFQGEACGQKIVECGWPSRGTRNVEHVHKRIRDHSFTARNTHSSTNRP